jgi:hypothetical protein
LKKILRSIELIIEKISLNSQVIEFSGDWSSYHYERSSSPISESLRNLFQT